MHVLMIRADGTRVVATAKWYGWSGEGLTPQELAYFRVECGCEVKAGKLWRCSRHTHIASVVVL